jgi:translation initiation factor IF-1
MTRMIVFLFFVFGGFGLWGQQDWDKPARDARIKAEREENIRRVAAESAAVQAEQAQRTFEVRVEQEVQRRLNVRDQEILTEKNVREQNMLTRANIQHQNALTRANLSGRNAYYGYNNNTNWGGYGWGGYGLYAPKLNPRECLQMGINCPGYLRVNLDPFKEMLSLPEFKNFSREEMGNHLKRLRLSQLFVAGDFRRTVGEMDGWNNRALVLPAGEHEVEIRIFGSGQTFKQVVHIGPGDTVKVTPYLLSDKGDMEFKIQVLPQNGQPQPEQKLKPTRH